MPETPNPTNNEFYAALPLVDSRASIAQNEIVRRLEQNMPDKIRYLNSILFAPGVEGIVQPTGYFVAPAVLANEHLNTVLVSVAVSTVAHSPAVFRNEAQVVIYAIDQRLQVKSQVNDTWDRAAIIRGILYSFLTGCEDAAGRQCWRKLEPTGVTMLPVNVDPENNYSGIACYYTMVQDPTVNNWI